MLARIARTFVRGGALANAAAVEAHTHPPERVIDPERFGAIAARSFTPEQLDRLRLPLLVSLPSFPDVHKLTLQRWNLGSLVFGPGLDIFMVATDETPRYSSAEVDKHASAHLDKVHEYEQLRADYITALRNGRLSGELAQTLEEMYRGQVPDSMSVSAFWTHNMTQLLSGEPHAVLFNPVVYRQLTDLKNMLEKLHCVGYYSLAGDESGSFSRFTAWAE